MPSLHPALLPLCCRSSPPQLSAELAAAVSTLSRCLWGRFGPVAKMQGFGGLGCQVVRLFTQLLPPYYATPEAVRGRPEAVCGTSSWASSCSWGPSRPRPGPTGQQSSRSWASWPSLPTPPSTQESAGGMALRGGGRQRKLAEVRFALLIDSLEGGAVESLAQGRDPRHPALQPYLRLALGELASSWQVWLGAAAKAARRAGAAPGGQAEAEGGAEEGGDSSEEEALGGTPGAYQVRRSTARCLWSRYSLNPGTPWPGRRRLACQ